MLSSRSFEYTRRLQVDPGHSAIQSLLPLVEAKASNFDDHALSLVLHAMARLRLDPASPAVSAVQRLVEEKLSSMRARDVSMSLNALSNLDQLQPSSLENLGKDLETQFTTASAQDLANALNAAARSGALRVLICSWSTGGYRLCS